MKVSRIAAVLIILTALQAYGADASPAAADPVPAASQVSTAVAFGANGLVFTNENNSTRLQVHGFLQGDGRFFSSDMKDQSPDKLLFRRIRPIFEGTLFNTLDFRFMPDFGQNNPQIQDIHVELRWLPFAKPRIGKFKTPIGLEALKSDNESSFSERSLASDLVPLRELGAQFGGSLWSNSITYAAGYFNGTTDGSNGNFQWRTSNEAAARIFLQPFITGRTKPLQGLGIGIAGSAANEHGKLPVCKTVGQNTFFKYSSNAVASGRHNRLSPQAYYYVGPVGVMGEYTMSSQNVLYRSTSRRLRNQAWEITTSIMLTGEKNSYSGVRPHYAFEPQKGIRHLGGWELATRYSRLTVDKDAFPLFANPNTAAQAASEWGVALNWHLNRFARIMNAYEHTRFDMASSKLTPLHGENVVMSRIQLGF